jgi:Flp pilus assembly protein TadG
MMKLKRPLGPRAVAAPAGPSSHRMDARLTRDDRGASAVELALIAPLLVLLLLGMVHFASVEVHRMQMTNAVRAGLQYASVRKPSGENAETLISEAVETAAPVADGRSVSSRLYCECPGGSQISCEDACSTGHRSAYVEIVMTDTFSPPLSHLAVKTVTLAARGTIRLN